MSNQERKQLQKDVGDKRRRRTKPYKDWGRLDLQLKEKPTVPMEEMRRQGLMLAGRQLGQGARSHCKAQEGVEFLET